MSVLQCSVALVPVATPVDREQVKSLILQGLSIKEVSTQTGVTEGVLRVWKSRFGWGKLLQVARQEYERGQESRLSKQLESASERVKTAMADELEQDLQVIKSKPAKTLAGVRDRQNVLSTMAGTGKILFAWDQGGSTTFNFNLLDSMKLAKGDTAQPIEVEQVSDLTKQSNSTDGIDSANPTP